MSKTAKVIEMSDQAREDALERWKPTEAAERTKMIGQDKETLSSIATSLDEIISGFELPAFNTSDAQFLCLGWIADLGAEIKKFYDDIAAFN